MTTGTEGNDILQNDGSGGSDTVDALGGDDTITVVTPAVVEQGYITGIVVNGGDGEDALITSMGDYRLSIGPDGMFVRQSLNYGFTVSWTGIEVLQITGTWYVNDTTTGATRDMLYLKGNSMTAAAEVISTGAGDDLIHISGTEAASVLAGDGDDYVSFNALGDVLGGAGSSADGGAGNDFLFGSDFAYRNGDETLIGGLGVDAVYGNGGDDILYGDGTVSGPDDGADTLDGGTGSDTMHGGGGSDLYRVDSVGDVVIEDGEGGLDWVVTPLGSRSDPAAMYVLPSGVEYLTGESATGQGVHGNALDNYILMGNGGDLVVLQDGGNDRVQSGGGNDFLFYGAAFTSADSNDGGDGFDTVALLGAYSVTFDGDDLTAIEKLALYSSGGAGTNDYSVTFQDAAVAAGTELLVTAASLTASETLVFNGAAEQDGRFSVLAGAAADTIAGGQQKDYLAGGAGGDLLYGLGGNDTLFGGAGADTLTGGQGRDWYRYESVGDSSASGGIDTIVGFGVGGTGERIDLSAIDADAGAGGDQAFRWIGVDTAFSGAAGELRVVQQDGGWFVEGDVDGNGAADLVIQIANGAEILWASNHFLL